MPRLGKSARRLGVQVGYRIAGLPIALRGRGRSPDTVGDEVRGAYARLYFAPARPVEWLHIALAVALAPLVVVLLASVFCWRNGRAIAQSHGRPAFLQWLDQIRLYVGEGVLAPWYYSFELFRQPSRRNARAFIYRWESKGGVNAIIRRSRRPTSNLQDKIAFAERCRRLGIPAVPILAKAQDGAITWHEDEGQAAAADWIVKPVAGKGGKGIERWDRAGEDRFSGAGGRLLQREELLGRIAERSRQVPLLIQPRIVNHKDLEPLCNGALATTRALTCLNERDEPELVGAVLRMARSNNVVDNFHAGGIAAAIDLSTGRLGRASDIGMVVGLGWLDAHPVTGAVIRGRVFPFWDELAAFVENAHRQFADRALIGWDVAATPSGLVVVEANGSPDLDIMQRATLTGMMPGRFGQLLAHQLRLCARRRR